MNISHQLASKIDTAPLLFCEYTCRNSNVKFQYKKILVQEVRAAIAMIKTNNSFGNDNISCQ